MTWTSERVTKLRELWAEGFSCSQIAAHIGGTRNSIIGKVHRLGLDGRNPGRTNGTLPGNHPRKAKARWKSKRPHKQQFNFGTVSLLCRTEAPGADASPCQPLPALPPSEMKRVPFLELKHGMCKWPLWAGPEDSHRDCCGLPAKDFGPYCAHHFAVSRVPIKPKTRAA